MAKKQLSNDVKVLIGMVVVITAPSILTLITIAQPRSLVTDLKASPTHYGYTWSLSLFVVPVIVLACWLSTRWESRIQNRAFWLTALIISATGILLDILFGSSFFTFPNRDAVLGIYVKGYSFSNASTQGIPIEEFGFYIFGALAVLLVYVWGDEFWFAAYNVDDAPRRKTRTRHVITFHPASAIFGLIVFLLALFYKKFGHGANHQGFPAYFLFLTLTALTPSILFFPIARPFINWRAFSFGSLFILLVSLFWEAAVAVPYQWWGFQPKQMIGVFINGFCGLPIEEPMLWLGVSWATVIMYEAISTFLFMFWADAVPKACER